MPDIFCKDCRVKVGHITKANLMKGLFHQCPSCNKKETMKKSADELKKQTAKRNPFGDMFDGWVK